METFERNFSVFSVILFFWSNELQYYGYELVMWDL